MGCCVSSPHTKRRYRDPADMDEEYVPLRYFGTNRVGSNLVPDDIDGLPSTHMHDHLAANTDVILYEGEIDHGKAYRSYRMFYLCGFTPWGIAYIMTKSVGHLCSLCSCDEACCWVRKEYSTRSFFRVYSNRIEVNEPLLRCPFGLFGCGSWNSDNVVTNMFDRGAFGFQHVRVGSLDYMCCCWPMYGGTVARHRCQCNGPVWNRMFTDCGGWWCDEWLCQMFFCTYRYKGLAKPDEVAFAASIALQAYFEGRAITPQDMDKCIKFWQDNIAERTDPIGRKRAVCCEPVIVPCPMFVCCYKCTHPKRDIPYDEEQHTDELREVYDRYNKERLSQIEQYEKFVGPVQNSTLCRQCGCRQFFGRKGFCFCTEGCCDGSSKRKAGEPAPPFVKDHFFDDEWDASSVLMKVLGPPPKNVVIRRWRWDPEKGENYLYEYPSPKETELSA